MSVIDAGAITAIPAGWYPDPAATSGLRWWSGEAWTEHTTPDPAPRIVERDDVPELSRFSRDPLVSGQPEAVPSATQLAQRKDPYRDRNVISGIALAVSILGLFAFIGGQMFGLPDTVQYIAGAAPFSLATLAIVVSIRTGRGLAVAILAAVLCLVNVAMVTVLAATEARQELTGSLTENSTFQPVMEQAAIEFADTQALPATVVSADCPDIPLPAAGTVTDCTVTLDNGDSYLLHITAKDGLGGMTLALEDQPIAGR